MKTLLHKLFARKSSPKRRPEPRRPLLRLEALEDRLVMSVTNHGGSILPHVEVNAVFYGSAWATDPTGTAPSAEAYLKGSLPAILNSPFMDLLGKAGYGVGRGSASANDVWDNLDTTQPLTATP